LDLTGHLLPAAGSRAHRSLSAAAVITASATAAAAATDDADADATIVVPLPPRTPTPSTKVHRHCINLFRDPLPITQLPSSYSSSRRTPVPPPPSLLTLRRPPRLLLLLLRMSCSSDSVTVEWWRVGTARVGAGGTSRVSSPPDRAEKSGLPATRKRSPGRRRRPRPRRLRQINLLATQTHT